MKPLYVVNLGNGTYYARGTAYKGVPRTDAAKMSHKEANAISNKLKHPKLGYAASIEPA